MIRYTDMPGLAGEGTEDSGFDWRVRVANLDTLASHKFTAHDIDRTYHGYRRNQFNPYTASTQWLEVSFRKLRTYFLVVIVKKFS